MAAAGHAKTVIVRSIRDPTNMGRLEAMNTRTNLRSACVIGSGPNGLAAAIVLAQAGPSVTVYEAQSVAGGGARTMELTLPGFQHDLGSAVHPLAVGSPFFSSLPLQDYGLEWIQPPAAAAHPLDGVEALMLERNLDEAALELESDGAAWRGLFGPFSQSWDDVTEDVLRPISLLPRHPSLMGRFGFNAMRPAKALANAKFRNTRTRALFAGLAAHSVLSLDAPFSSAAALMLGTAAHAVGWPIPRGGAASITRALCGYLAEFGVTVETEHPVNSLADLPKVDLTLCDVTPRQLLQIAGQRLADSYRRQLTKYRYGPGVFKVDFALSSPIPWKAGECKRAATVHVGGSLEEIAASEHDMSHGRHAEKPFVLLTQPSLFDSSRAPEGKHTAWAYCHVPNGSNFDMLERVENQIERFAPGFRDCVLARHVFRPADLEALDGNLIGGDIVGGASDMWQLFFRPTWRQYATSARDIYICSASTPPGGGVHGMCGYNAAKLALSRL
jgi:phytoene dehydrogenase-like protein